MNHTPIARAARSLIAAAALAVAFALTAPHYGTAHAAPLMQGPRSLGGHSYIAPAPQPLGGHSY